MNLELEKSIKKTSIEIFKLRLKMDELIKQNKSISIDDLKNLNKALTNIDKKLLKETGVKFSDKVRKDFVTLID